MTSHSFQTAQDHAKKRVLEALEVIRVNVRVNERVDVRSYSIKHCGHAAGNRSEKQDDAGSVNDRYSHRSFGDCMADANRDEAERAAELGRAFLNQQEYERAIRLLERSNALYPLPNTAHARMNWCSVVATSKFWHFHGFPLSVFLRSGASKSCSASI